MSAHHGTLQLHWNEDTGILELTEDGETVWSSDADPEVLDELGTDDIRAEDIPDVLDYLVDERRLLSSEAADDLFDELFPEERPGEPDDEEDDDEEDDDLSVIEGEAELLE